MKVSPYRAGPYKGNIFIRYGAAGEEDEGHIDLRLRIKCAPVHMWHHDVTQDDIETLGQEWHLQNDPEFGACAKFQIRWATPDESGVKYSFSNKTNDWKKGGAGGWNTLLQSRLPTPIRLNPNDGYDALEKVVKDLASKNAAKKL